MCSLPSELIDKIFGYTNNVEMISLFPEIISTETKKYLLKDFNIDTEISYGRIENVKMLFSCGFLPNEKAVRSACKNNDLEMVQFLVNTVGLNSKVDDTRLTNDLEIVKFLEQKMKFKWDKYDLSNQIVNFGSDKRTYNIFKHIHQRSNIILSNRHLSKAVGYENFYIVKYILEQGVKPAKHVIQKNIYSRNYKSTLENYIIFKSLQECL